MHFSRLLLLGLLFCAACAGPRRTANRTDGHGLSRGRYHTYYGDSARSQPYTVGRFRHGRPVGQFRYFAPTGKVEKTERYGADGFCEVTYYYPGGQVERRGHAQWVTGAKGARFFWFGPWIYYDEAGQITAIQTYTDGTHTATDVYTNGRHTGTEIYKNGQLVETRPVQ